MELAVAEINASGGLLGRPLELVVRDDTGNPGEAVRVAEEVITRQKSDLVMGTVSSRGGRGSRRDRGAAGKNRRRTGCAGDDRQQARGNFLVAVCGRPFQIRARG